MSEKVIWSSKMTQDYIKGLSDEEKHNMLTDRGYDAEMLTDANLDDVIDNDDYMWQDDTDDFESTIVPMINQQTANGIVLALNKDDLQGDLLVLTDANQLNTGDICPEAVSAKLIDDNGLVMEYLDKEGNPIQSLLLFGVPTDEAEQKEFIDTFMPEVNEVIATADDEDPVASTTEIIEDPSNFEDFIDNDKLRQSGPRLVSTITPTEEPTESLDEAIELDEAIPKPLAKAYRNTVNTHGK